MTVQQRGGRFRAFGAAAFAVGLALLVCGPAAAGPIGAGGDVYVADGDVGGIFQYDGVTGASVGLFASRAPRTFMGQAWGPDGNLYAVSNANTNRWDVDKYRWQHRRPDCNRRTAPQRWQCFRGQGARLRSGRRSLRRRLVSRRGSTVTRPAHLRLKPATSHVTGDNLGTPNYMTFAPNGNLMVVSGGYNRVLQFNTSGGGVNLLGTFATFDTAQQPQDLAFGPNGNLFVTGGYAGGVREFDGASGAFVRRLRAAERQ